MGDNINTMKKTFGFNFDLYQAFKHRNQEKVSIKNCFTLIPFKLVIRKKIIYNQNLD